MGGLQILVHQATCVDLAERRGDAHGQGQEAVHRHGSAQPAREGLAALILEHERAGPAFALKCQGPRRPCPVQHILQAEFVGQAIEATRAGMLRGRHHGQHSAPLAVLRLMPSSAKGALTLLP